MKKILFLYKEEGETPLERINRFKRENSEYEALPMTYAGRLDPMAEGVLLVLADDEVKSKDKYIALDKIYEFEVLFGVSTDTGDILGVIEEVDDTDVIVNEDFLESFVGKLKQKYPPFSSRTINGVPMWRLARDRKLKEEDIPETEVELYNIQLLGEYEIGSDKLIQGVLSRIKKVKGDFRQDVVLKSWIKSLNKKRNFHVAKIRINVSSGFYVRVFAQDIAKKLGTCALALSIKRISIGDFIKE